MLLISLCFSYLYVAQHSFGKLVAIDDVMDFDLVPVVAPKTNYVLQYRQTKDRT